MDAKNTLHITASNKVTEAIDTDAVAQELLRDMCAHWQSRAEHFTLAAKRQRRIACIFTLCSAAMSIASVLAPPWSWPMPAPSWSWPMPALSFISLVWAFKHLRLSKKHLTLAGDALQEMSDGQCQ